MASIVNDQGGRRRILFVNAEGVRKTIRLGKCDRKSAESICRHVETLLSARKNAEPILPATAAWLADVGPKLRERLAIVGLIEPEKRITAGEFLASWLEGKRNGGYKPASLIAWGQTVKELTLMFGATQLNKLTHADGEAYRSAMKDRGLRPTTVNKRLIHGRQMLEDAVRFRYLAVNPWKHVKQRQGDPWVSSCYLGGIFGVGRGRLKSARILHRFFTKGVEPWRIRVRPIRPKLANNASRPS